MIALAGGCRAFRPPGQVLLLVPRGRRALVVPYSPAHDRPVSDIEVPSGRTRSGSARQHLAWLAAGFVIGFVVPFLFADILQLPRDLYHGVYMASLLTLLSSGYGRLGSAST